MNADNLARELEVDPYEAAEVAKQLPRGVGGAGRELRFETVFSDPVGDKLDFLRRASTRGYTVVLSLIGLDSPELSADTTGGGELRPRPAARLLSSIPIDARSCGVVVTEEETFLRDLMPGDRG